MLFRSKTIVWNHLPNRPWFSKPEEIAYTIVVYYQDLFTSANSCVAKEGSVPNLNVIDEDMNTSLPNTFMEWEVHQALK